MARRRPPYHSLRHRDFRRLWTAQLVSLTGSQMQIVAIHWHVYLLTRSPLALGMIGLTRVLPVVFFSLLGGVVADRRDRRIVMLISQSAMAVVAAALAATTFAGVETVPMLYGLTALSAAATAFDSPARQALVPRLVPEEELQGALSVNLTVFHAAMIGGPALAGFLIAGGSAALRAMGPPQGGIEGTTGLAVIYLINALSFLGVIAALASMSRDAGRPSGTRHAPGLHALRDGLRFVFSTPILVWTMTLDFVATFFSGAMSLLPIFADQVLHSGPSGYGILVAAPAVGALLGSLYTSARPLANRQGPLLLASVGIYGLATIAFGVSRSLALMWICLALVGLSDLVSTVIRQTVRQLVTPDELRGRMTSVNMIFFMGGPQLGEVEAGLVASLFASAAVGATVSVVSGGLATILVTAAAAVLSPVLRRYDLSDILRASPAPAPEVIAPGSTAPR